MRQRLADFGVGDQVVEEGPLAAQGLQRPVRLDAAMVDAARQIEKPFGAVAEMRREPDRVLRGEIGARKDAEPLHLRRGHRAASVEAATRVRKSDVEGNRVSVRVGPGGRLDITKNKKNK